MTTEPDDTMIRIGRGIALAGQGERAAAMGWFTKLWDDIGPDGDPLHRCAVAHAMADVQDDPRAELACYLRALEAVESLTDERLGAAGVAGSARGFYPSLHLNLADVYRRLGNEDPARRHLELGRATLDALQDDGYRTMIREALDRVEHKLGPP